MTNSNYMNTSGFEDFFTSLTPTDKSFGLLLLALIGAYGVKRHFDSTDKAMDCGYNSELHLREYGTLKFTRSQESQKLSSSVHDKRLEEEPTEELL